MEETFAEVCDNLFFLFDEVLQYFIFFMLLLRLMLIDEVFLLIGLFDFELLIGFGEFFIFVDDFVEFFLFFLNMRLDVRKFIVGVLLNDPFEFG